MLREHIILEPEQIELLSKFVEAERQAPKGARGKFLTITSHRIGGAPTTFIYNGGGGIKVSGSMTDAEILAEKGLLGLSYGSKGSQQFYVKPEAIQYYRELKQEAQPLEAVNKEVREFLSSDEFKDSFPAAFKKWADAGALLWESDSEQQFTTIGHLCREALQEFADALVQKYNPPNIDPDKAHTVSRIKNILQMRSSNLGSTEKDFLESLITFWQSASNLVQRQEHGGQREGTRLTWEDARRVVFQTGIVMYEVDRSLTRTNPARRK